MRRHLNLMPRPGSMTYVGYTRLGHLAVRAAGGYLPFSLGGPGDADAGAWHASTGTHNLRVSIAYLDIGTEDIILQWYSAAGTITSTTVVTKGNTGYHRVAAVSLSAARLYGEFIDYQGADLLFYCAGDLVLTRVQIRDTTRNMRAAWYADNDTDGLILDAPYLDDFTNAAHNHSNAPGGTKLAQANTHESPDTDAATTSLHHTVGAGATQAAAGNHTHGSSGIVVLGIVSPAQITGNQNNYNPGAGGLFRLTANDVYDITGWMAPATAGTLICIYNISAYSLTFKDQSASSDAANRFAFSGAGGDYVLVRDRFLWLIYDGTTARWRDV